MLRRRADLSGFGGSGGGAGGGFGGVVSGSGGGTGCGGADTQAPRNKSASSAVAFETLVTEPNSHHIDIGGAQSAARHIEFTEIVNRPDVNAVIVAIVHPCALHARFDAV